MSKLYELEGLLKEFKKHADEFDIATSDGFNIARALETICHEILVLKAWKAYEEIGND